MHELILEAYVQSIPWEVTPTAVDSREKIPPRVSVSYSLFPYTPVLRLTWYITSLNLMAV